MGAYYRMCCMPTDLDGFCFCCAHHAQQIEDLKIVKTIGSMPPREFFITKPKEESDI